MNKYQKVILDNIDIRLYSNELAKDCTYSLDNLELSLFQDENYNITKYNLIIKADSISSIDIFDDEWINVKGYLNTFNIDIDFNRQIRKLKLSFNDDIADPIILDINYIYSSRDDYDLVLKEKNDDLLSKEARIRVTTGNALINVLFQPVGSNYAYTKIELYSFMDNEPLLMARYKVTDELYFLPIKDLAYGTYKIRVIEYDYNNDEIYTSPFFLVTLQRPLRNQVNNYDR